ncbi:sporulation histidine kinase inhibitor Sda [Paenibacillus thermoaerophilus]|uniref:Sporulation histidine kinase inhibitor Sda n=1 Tax=Paenibacillus thermoaerophilus TaxID=1215385 RepID=A0ABW2V4X5_9BACL|nr:sporulation histidine kinase inhibitor Sda [Paenibacillus thermoaerophilus]TMV18396.1 sporulation histidine kinase inhibitor Sda [Paenibacillus thermoaerophilus]
MKILSDENLLQAYRDAIDLALDPHFIYLLRSEISRRKLEPAYPSMHDFMPSDNGKLDE